MAHVILPNLQLVFCFICLVIENFKKVVICHFVMGSIVVYRITIILNTLNKVAHCMELKVVKTRST